MFKKNMRPLLRKPGAGGAHVANAGKGSQATSLPNRGALNALANAPGATMNNYAKATPLAQPGGDVSAGADPNLASGNSPGIGM